MTVFQEEVTKKLPEIDSIRKAGKYLIKAFTHAHTRILQAPLKVDPVLCTGTMFGH